MKKTEKVKIISQALEQRYPQVKCALYYEKPHELLIATRLSAQCTDKRVNIVTKDLFERYKSIDEFAEADVAEVGEYIKTCGLFNTKAKDIVLMCCQLRDRFGGAVPDNIDDLLTLSGVGRKTANLIVGDLYGKPAVVADTHVIRLSNRFGFTSSQDALKVENDLRKIIKPNQSLAFCHRLVWFGREVCTARSPKCTGCELSQICSFIK